MLKGLGGCKALAWVDLEQLANEVLGLQRHIIELLMLEVEAAFCDLCEDVRAVAALERQVAAHEDVEQHAQRPHVDL